MTSYAPRQRRVRIVLLAIGIPVCLIFLLYPLFSRRYLRPLREEDRFSAPAQEANATVAIYVPARSEESAGRYYQTRIMVRFMGRLIEPRNVLEPEKLSENSPVHITYRIGSSGRIYVDTARPMVSTKP